MTIFVLPALRVFPLTFLRLQFALLYFAYAEKEASTQLNSSGAGADDLRTEAGNKSQKSDRGY